MANRLYNKQVSPKGYMGGGRVKKAGGGSLKMVMKDGVGKMKKGGIAKLNPGLKAYMMKKKKAKKK